MIIDYVKFSAGGNSWKIPTSRTSDNSMTPYIYVGDIKGLLDLGESSNDSTPRSYSHGSVLPPVTYYSGKDMSFRLIFVGGGATAVNNYISFVNAAMGGYTTISSSLGASYTCKLVLAEVEDSSGNYIIANFAFKAREAF